MVWDGAESVPWDCLFNNLSVWGKITKTEEINSTGRELCTESPPLSLLPRRTSSPLSSTHPPRARVVVVDSFQSPLVTLLVSLCLSIRASSQPLPFNYSNFASVCTVFAVSTDSPCQFFLFELKLRFFIVGMFGFCLQLLFMPFVNASLANLAIPSIVSFATLKYLFHFLTIHRCTAL